MRGWVLMILLLTGYSSMATDTVIVKKDARLDMLSAKQLQSNQRSAMMAGNGLYKGFRIQVISTNKRDDAFQVKNDLQARFPEERTYISFQSPNFKVRIGNFLKKSEAEKLKTELNKIFPNGVYIVEDGVEYIPKESDGSIQQ